MKIIYTFEEKKKLIYNIWDSYKRTRREFMAIYIKLEIISKQYTNID